jgi:hypothetical protein
MPEIPFPGVCDEQVGCPLPLLYVLIRTELINEITAKKAKEWEAAIVARDNGKKLIKESLEPFLADPKYDFCKKCKLIKKLKG